MSIEIWILLLLLVIVIILAIIGIGRSSPEGEVVEGRRHFFGGRGGEIYEAQPIEVRGRVFRCPKCGAIVDPNAPRCPNCGVEFEIGSYACPECGGPVSLEDIYCPHCGALLLAEPYACPRCLRIVPPESTRCPWCGVEYWSPIRLDEETYKRLEKRVAKGRMMVERKMGA
ncbi:MAG: zinc ribbon domain-containing protein [Thermoplasmata archaeon]|nr:zinc ribbon domain-containing protein [Thermoplasmata archaeon]